MEVLQQQEIGSAHAEQALVDGLLEHDPADSDVMRIMKEITARFMEHMKVRTGMMMTPYAPLAHLSSPFAAACSTLTRRVCLLP